MKTAKPDEMDFDLASFEELFFSDEASNSGNRLFDLDETITQALRPVCPRRAVRKGLMPTAWNLILTHSVKKKHLRQDKA